MDPRDLKWTKTVRWGRGVTFEQRIFLNTFYPTKFLELSEGKASQCPDESKRKPDFLNNRFSVCVCFSIQVGNWVFASSRSRVRMTLDDLCWVNFSLQVMVKLNEKSETTLCDTNLRRTIKRTLPGLYIPYFSPIVMVK